MKILMLAINDPAGTAIAFTKAINRFTEHTCRLITKEIRYNFMFDKDLHLPWLSREELAEVEHFLKTSDIFHFHMTADIDIALGPFRPRDYLGGKMIVHHHHGHPDFRAHPLKYRQKYRENRWNKLLVSTPDLLHLLPEARWQPNLVPIHDPLYLPWATKRDFPISIAHSPTRKDLKNTANLIQVMAELKSSSTAVELQLIENTEHKECLRQKRRCHILFDHLQGYYGISSLEGLSQGLCVVAGLDGWNQHHLKKFTEQDTLPWVITDARNLARDLKELVNDKARQKFVSTLSRQFMERHWNEKTVTTELLNFYLS